MDLSVSRLSAIVSEPAASSEPRYPTFAAPTPVHPSRSYVGNTLTPGSLPSPLNFPTITPPSSPYSLYGLYSPAGSSTSAGPSPSYDPAYLRRLKSNPIFRDLQSLLLQECSQMEVPANLITTSWNLMQLHKPAPTTDQAPPTAGQALPTIAQPTNQTTALGTGSGQKVYIRHMQLQDKLLKVRIDSAISADGLAVENTYSKEVGTTEMNRYRALGSCPSDTVKTTINEYYDRERLQLADKTEQQLDSLINKAETMRQAAIKANINSVSSRDSNSIQGRLPTTQDSSSSLQGRLPTTDSTTSSSQGRLPTQDSSASDHQGASLLLQPVDDAAAAADSKLTAVRKLKFNISDECVEPEDEEENDYLNGSVNSEDFEIDEIDVETVDKDEAEFGEQKPETVTQEFPELSPASSHSSDLLQQCLAESGLDMVVGDDASIAIDRRSTSGASSVDSERSINSGDSFSDCDRNVRVASSSDCVMSLYNSVSSSSDNLTTSTSTPKLESYSTDSYHSNQRFSNTSNNFMPFPPKTELFGTPQNFGSLMFTQPDKINLALSEIGKLCGGPSVTFTPEMRREATFTPELPGFSPLTSMGNSMNTSGLCHNVPTVSSQDSQEWSHPAYRGSSITSRSGSGQKRKSPCDEEEHDFTSTQQIDSGRSEVTSATDNNDPNQLLNNPVFKTHRMLTAEATNVLNQWYANHVQYPYPSDAEVQHLSQATGITGRQVKKWMANKRVRCFNTLSITGNQHPIKFKYGSQGRKKKSNTTQPTHSSTAEKENCDSTTDSTTNSKKPNYSLLTDEAKLILNHWYEQHENHPYPTEEEKSQLAAACNISVGQVKSWFANKRNRTNNTKRQVPNYFISKFPEYQGMVQYVGQRREEARMVKRRKVNHMNMYIQPNFYF